MSIHEGHRQRLKQRFLEEGLDKFTDIQVLELLLFYCIPRKDTNPIAHALLAHFGSLSQVLEAPVEELRKVEGVGESAALFLHLTTEVSRFYLALNPAMLFVDTTVMEVITISITSFVGIFAIAAALEGYLLGHMPWYLRAVSLAGGLLLIIPGLVTDLVGTALVALMAMAQFASSKKTAAIGK